MSRHHRDHRSGRHRQGSGPRPGGSSPPGAHPEGRHHLPGPRRPLADVPDVPHIPEPRSVGTARNTGGPEPGQAGSAERTTGLPAPRPPVPRDRAVRAPDHPPTERLSTERVRREPLRRSTERVRREPLEPRTNGAPGPTASRPNGMPAPARPGRVPVDAATDGAGRDTPDGSVRAALPRGGTTVEPRVAGSTSTAEPDRGGSAVERGRLLGVDVARGVALFGIIAVHALVESGADGAPSVSYLVFGGRSAALFALLAGVALAFMTGRARAPREGFGATAAMVAARAGVLLVLGLALGWTDPEIAAVILPYYAVMFLLAIPLLRLPTGVLAAVTVALVGAVPVLSQLVRPSLPVGSLGNPDVVDLVTDPVGLLCELTLTGAYPAVAWLAYLAAGIVVGRVVSLSSTRTATTLLGVGTLVAVVATGVSWWLLTRAGGYTAIAAATPPERLATAPTVVDHVNGSPGGVTPTTTWWWLATTAPHSGTPLDLAQTIGSALAVLGAALLLAGVARRGTEPRRSSGEAAAPASVLGFVLRPVAAAGSMTLTLYTVSLLFMNSALDTFGPLEGYLWQIGAALVIATAWRRAVGRGPLEAATSMTAHAARDRVRRAGPGSRASHR